ncbi:hypothetical protein PPACK8108_LOCUS24557, partial [Phakopsora pachyrhizi]
MIFGVGEGTVVLYTTQVIQAIHNMKDYKVKWPSKEEQKESFQVMQLEGFPNCVGLVDGTSLSLSQKPALDGNVYFDCKKRSKDEIESLIKWAVACIILHNMLVNIGDVWEELFMDDETPESYNTNTYGNTQSTIQMRERILPF